MGGTTQSHHYDTGEAPESQEPDWMSRIPDDTSLANLTIPGSHRSLSFYGGSMYQCQSWSLEQQLMSGIRFIDIRCRHYDNDLPLYYSFIFQYCYFKDVLETTMAFLNQHSTEAVLLHLKDEYIPAYNENTFQDTLLGFMSKYDENRFWLKPEIPTLGDCRGRIVLIQEFPSTVPMGLPYYKTFKLEEDSWVPTLLNMHSRWEKAKENLDGALRKERLPGQMSLTYCSGSGIAAYPYSVASYINWYLAEYVKVKEEASLGIVAMDFPGAGLISDLIKTNCPVAQTVAD